ncbi:MAG: dihydrofolate reductase [Acidobacteria bacterium]|nr:dihydrofolate reductase [Acidobacteriota bacterium]
MAVIGIVAIAKNLAIGKDGKLPWHYAADLKFFKETTTGHAIVMGATTWGSIGRPLPGRMNIVLSRNDGLDIPDGVRLVASKAEVLQLAETLETDVFVIGGAQVFASFADDIEKWIVTDVPVTVEDADAFMPADFLNGFEVESTRDLGDGLTVKRYTRSSQN